MRRRVQRVAEAIMVVDIVEATATTNRFGWDVVGRQLVRNLRTRIQQIGPQYGLSCRKSTGDGYLLAFANKRSAGRAVIQAVEAAFAILDTMQRRNQRIAAHLQINLRFAVHFGQVDAVDDDREGPHVSYAFRLEAINALSLADAINSIPPGDFPDKNYIIASEEVKNILNQYDKRWSCVHCGTFRLKGFNGWHDVFLIGRISD